MISVKVQAQFDGSENALVTLQAVSQVHKRVEGTDKVSGILEARAIAEDFDFMRSGCDYTRVVVVEQHFPAANIVELADNILSLKMRDGQ